MNILTPKQVEQYKKLSTMFKGRKNEWLVGKPRTEEVKRKIGLKNSIKLKGRHLSIETRQKMSEAKMGHSVSKKTRELIGLIHKGKPLLKNRGIKNRNWKGGITKLNNYGKLYQAKRREKLAGRKKSESCEVCGVIEKICFDHDHKTGKFRGWICFKCNIVLGLVKDNPELLSKLINYLKRS